jgi:hypothetical protein
MLLSKHRACQRAAGLPGRFYLIEFTRIKRTRRDWKVCAAGVRARTADGVRTSIKDNGDIPHFPFCQETGSVPIQLLNDANPVRPAQDHDVRRPCREQPHGDHAGDLVDS